MGTGTVSAVRNQLHLQQNGLRQHLYKLCLPQECEANLSPNRVCSYLSSAPSLSIYGIMCAANDNHGVEAHAALQPQYFCQSKWQQQPRHGEANYKL